MSALKTGEAFVIVGTWTIAANCAGSLNVVIVKMFTDFDGFIVVVAKRSVAILERRAIKSSKKIKLVFKPFSRLNCTILSLGWAALSRLCDWNATKLFIVLWRCRTLFLFAFFFAINDTEKAYHKK